MRIMPVLITSITLSERIFPFWTLNDDVKEIKKHYLFILL